MQGFGANYWDKFFVKKSYWHSQRKNIEIPCGFKMYCDIKCYPLLANWEPTKTCDGFANFTFKE